MADCLAGSPADCGHAGQFLQVAIHTANLYELVTAGYLGTRKGNQRSKAQSGDGQRKGLQ